MNRNKILEHLQEYGVCNEAIYYIKNLEKEIERLKDQLQQKENIIKEVREYIKQTGQYLEDIKRFKVDVLEPNYLDILEILDKENI